MIRSFIERFQEIQPALEERFKKVRPLDYEDILVGALALMFPKGADKSYEMPDPNIIHKIDDGHYQGKLLFIIPQRGSQPDTYWWTEICYGSCSGCDTFIAIGGYDSDSPVTPDQAKDYATLALHMIEKMKMLTGWDEEEEEGDDE